MTTRPPLLVDRETWERIKADYCAAVGVAFEKDHYLTHPGGTWTETDIDRARRLAEQRWQEVVGDVD